ncbi:uncharacterized protein STEHIDRAFT_65305 [Stereum hirsutum FP-91666 SS1]|uniref:uncharacterized protein n=1 Tax=Stereum hirsutum (strain FP-91666) TaxID=721885 RepID=UPI000444A554|nr:uncharacterized protein STEHIDRAFT_65305 [Stereum hirsutum FP-91666 SS1]EIM81861.1 hypothetical protein STEHIDRAFT_65305 [Stereum hirsutum FP-91666 SS1]
MSSFGDFAPLCTHTPSYPWCNLFYTQISRHNASVFSGSSSSASSAPVGINPVCGILRTGTGQSLGNVAQVVACALSLVFMVWLIWATGRRKAAVGRIELRTFFILYFLTLPFNLLTSSSLLEQGSSALTVLTAIHAGLVAALFWTLLGNAIVATQVVEDGTMSSMVPFSFLTLALFIITTYIALDTAFSFTSTFGPSSPLASENSVTLFVLTSVWPAAATLLYFILMAYIVLGILRELRPLWYYLLSGILFVLSQLAWFLLGRVVCSGSGAKVDGSFIATVLETAAVYVLYLAWKNITEESWDEEVYYPR